MCSLLSLILIRHKVTPQFYILNFKFSILKNGEWRMNVFASLSYFDPSRSDTAILHSQFSILNSQKMVTKRIQFSLNM